MGSPDAAGSDAATQADGPSPEPDAAADAVTDSRPVGDTMVEPTVEASAFLDASTPIDASALIEASANGDASSGVDAGGSPCADANACRSFSNYCGGCTCQALGTGEPNPACDAGTVSCLLDPCLSRTAVCDLTGRCILR